MQHPKSGGCPKNGPDWMCDVHSEATPCSTRQMQHMHPRSTKRVHPFHYHPDVTSVAVGCAILMLFLKLLNVKCTCEPQQSMPCFVPLW
jgi:hypothetical protein